MELGDRAAGSGRKGMMCSDTLWQLISWFTRLIHEHMLDPTGDAPNPQNRNSRVLNGAKRAGFSGDCDADMGHQRRHVIIKLNSLVTMADKT